MQSNSDRASLKKLLSVLIVQVSKPPFTPVVPFAPVLLFQNVCDALFPFSPPRSRTAELYDISAVPSMLIREHVPKRAPAS